ncbi:hypothetical protein LCGC14_2118420, partial [marine sediment metagenome]
GNSNRVSVLVTGIAFDLVNLRPEICVLIAINSKDWKEEHIDSWADKKSRAGKVSKVWRVTGNYEIDQFLDDQDFNLDEDIIKDLECVPPEKTVQIGAIAFHLGSIALRKLSKSL